MFRIFLRACIATEQKSKSFNLFLIFFFAPRAIVKLVRLSECLTSYFPSPASHFTSRTSHFPNPTSRVWLPKSDFSLHKSDFTSPTSQVRLPKSDFLSPTSRVRLHKSDFSLHKSLTSHFPSPTSQVRLHKSDFTSTTSQVRLPKSDFPSPTSYFPRNAVSMCKLSIRSILLITLPKTESRKLCCVSCARVKTLNSWKHFHWKQQKHW